MENSETIYQAIERRINSLELLPLKRTIGNNRYINEVLGSMAEDLIATGESHIKEYDYHSALQFLLCANKLYSELDKDRSLEKRVLDVQSTIFGILMSLERIDIEEICKLAAEFYKKAHESIVYFEPVSNPVRSLN